MIYQIYHRLAHCYWRLAGIFDEGSPVEAEGQFSGVDGRARAVVANNAKGFALDALRFQFITLRKFRKVNN